tara:strand:- start:125 stop:304 length:180 start_codon:yes stop_codon:yes gene_type:complete
VLEITEITPLPDSKRTQPNEDEINSKSIRSTEPNLTVPGGRLGNTVRAVRIFHTLNEEP